MHEVIKNYIPDEITYLAQILNDAGFNIYIVGGFVRDIFLGSCDIYENDIDICGDCAPDTFADIVKNNDNIRLCDANFPLGTLKLIIGRIDIEYTCFRTESYRGDGHHTPSEIVFTKDMYQDALRRDFSANALYLDPLTYTITDFFGGQQDIDSKIIKTVRDSVEVFTEDALRLVRMCRFAAKLGFEIDKSTLSGARKCAHLLRNISKERIGAELDKTIMSDEHFNFGIDALYKSHINRIICWRVSIAAARKVHHASSDRYIRWAIFLSDGSPKHANHYILKLSLGKDLADEVERLLHDTRLFHESTNHIIMHFAKIGILKTKRQIEFMNIVSDKSLDNIIDIYCRMKENNQFISYDMLAINGHDIIELFSAKGKEIRKIKDAAYEYAVLNPNKNNYDDLKNYLISIFHNNNLT